ncbi:MAG: LD-carboxypeptidase [Eggerthellaceae bacterium]|nr:LD-carboxypeptidase [Eggerthellaceae bacterium]
MKRMRIAGIGLLVAAMLMLASCGQAQEAPEEDTVSQGVDTPCTVSYSEKAAASDAYFLAEGDSIAVITPSALPSDEQVDAVVKGLKEWGYVPVEGKHVRGTERTLQDCIDDLTWALEDPAIKGIFCVRGGYGASEVLDEIPLELIASSKKPVIGYSDISVLHSAWTSAGIPSFHACMSATFSDLDKSCVEAEQRILRGEIPSYTCKPATPGKEGKAKGILIGGNLSTFTSVLGTAYDSTKIDKPYILFLEDIGEDVQHVHRYLAVLKHLGVLDHASGIVFGEWTEVPVDMDDYDGGSRGGTFNSMTDMIKRQYLDDLDIPVAFDFPAGHGDVNYPLLMGVEAQLDVSSDSYTLSW